jgi:lipopolysaccharide export system permease protein
MNIASLKIKLLDRYLSSELLEPLVFAILAFTMILAGGGILFTLVKEIIRYGLALKTALKLFILRLPAIMVFTFPMAMLLATILTVGRLSTDGEITAFKAAGISLGRLATPAIIVSFLVSLVSICFNESVVPRANQEATRLFLQIARQERPKIKENLTVPIYEKGVLKRVLSAHKLEGNLLKEVTIQEFESGGLVRLITARSARWLGEAGWVFENGRFFQIAPDGESLYVIKFKEEKLNLPSTPEELSEEEKSPEEMNWTQLKQFILRKEKKGQDSTADKVTLNFKLSIPLATLIFTIIGFPLGAQPHRGGKSVGFGISLLVIFGYYVLFSISMGLGMSGVIPPFLSAWLPNLITGGIGLYLIKKASD